MRHDPFPRADTQPALSDEAVPTGFERLSDAGGFLAGFGPLYWHAGKRIVRIRIAEHHLNHLGIPHGGMLATLADSAIGIAMFRESGRTRPNVTVNLSLDYLSAASVGDWVDACVEIDKMGARLRFGSCRLMVGERCLLKANATFAVM